MPSRTAGEETRAQAPRAYLRQRRAALAAEAMQAARPKRGPKAGGAGGAGKLTAGDPDHEHLPAPGILSQDF